MIENQLTSQLVYNYLRQRQQYTSCPHTSNNNSKLNLKIEYANYSPKKIGSFYQKNIYQTFYMPQKKQLLNKNNLSSKSKQYTPITRCSPLQSQQKINKKKKVYIDFDVQLQNDIDQKINITKIGDLNLNSEINKNNIGQLEKNIMKKKQSSRFKNKYKFGLEIRQIQKIQYENIKQTTSYIKSQYKKKMTIDYQPQSLQYSSSKKLTEEDKKNEKSQQFTKLSKIFAAKSEIKKLSVTKKDKKNQDERSIEKRIERMLNFFSLVLYSYGCFMKRPDQQMLLSVTKGKKKGNKFSYYIGSGNNKNLIISLMKKRWWWTQAQDINSADFVWTQLKIPSIMQNQPSMMFTDIQLVNSQIYKVQQSKLPSFLKTRKQFINYYKLFHLDMKTKYFTKLSEFEQKTLLRQLKPPTVLHNHYEANYMLGNKKALFHNICQYYQYLNQSPYDIIPQTYHIQKTNSKNWKLFQQEARYKTVWVVKPGENTNRGTGIFVQSSAQKIKKRIDGNKKQNRTYIIQKYITNLFLFQRRKFDIRTYLLAVNIGGVMKFYWYSQGYLRTSSQLYDIKDLTDIYIHLTNDAIQCKNDNYGKFEQGNKISYHQFQRYLDSTYPNQKYSIKQLSEKMKDIAKKVVKATYLKIDPPMKQEAFQLFGMDFLIDSNFRPWLLEVNTNPCLQLSSASLERLLPRMLQNVFRVSLDPIFQPSSQCPRSLAYYIPDNMIQNNRFELIFDSMFDRDLVWQRKEKQVAQKIQYEDQNDQFDNDGQIIAIDF